MVKSARKKKNPEGAALGTASDEPPVKGGKAKARMGKKAVVGYFSMELSESMHRIAAREGKKIQALVGEAIDMLFEDRDMTPMGER